MDQSKIFNIFILNKYFEKMFGIHYPREIIYIITMINYHTTKINCGYYKMSIIRKYCDHNMKIVSNPIYFFDENINLSQTQNLFKEINEHNEIKEAIEIVHGNSYNIVMLSNSDNIYVWDSVYGPGLTLMNSRLQQIKLPFRVKTIKVRYYDVIALADDGHVYKLSGDINGLFGYNKFIYKQNPTIIDKLREIVEISCGNSHSLALSSTGICYAWGSNSFGELGLNDTINRIFPGKINLSEVISISCGSQHNAILTTSKIIYIWGRNIEGQLGLGHWKNVFSPKKVYLNNVISVKCGTAHTIALTKNNELYSWGSNLYGELGIGNYENKSVPLKIYFNENIDSIFCGSGSNTSFILASAGKIYTCGKQIGTGTSNVPKEMVLEDIKQKF